MTYRDVSSYLELQRQRRQNIPTRPARGNTGSASPNKPSQKRRQHQKRLTRPLTHSQVMPHQQSWLHPIAIVSIEDIPGASTQHTAPAAAARVEEQLGQWLANFELDIIDSHSTVNFAQLKLQELLQLTQEPSSCGSTRPSQLRTAVVCNLVERLGHSLLQMESMKHHHSLIRQLQHHVFCAIYEDMPDFATTVPRAPHTLSWFMQQQPYFQQLDIFRNADRGETLRHQQVFRKFFASKFQLLSQTFQMWRTTVREGRSEQLMIRGFQLTSNLLSMRSKRRLTFTAWVRFTLERKVSKYQSMLMATNE